MRNLIILIVVVLLLGGGGFAGASVYFEWPPVWGFYQSARGYGPAKTPEEALEKFAKAVKDRDFVSASEYCTADFAKPMHNSAASAKALGVAIDNLEHNMTQENIKSNKCKIWLRRLEPFPKVIQYKITLNAKDDNATRAAAQIWEDLRDIQADTDKWQVDFRPFRALSGGAAHPMLESGSAIPVDLVKDKGSWKIAFPFGANQTDIQQRTADLNKYYQDYVRPLDKLKYEIKRDSSTKNELEQRLKEEMEKAKPS